MSGACGVRVFAELDSLAALNLVIATRPGSAQDIKSMYVDCPIKEYLLSFLEIFSESAMHQQKRQSILCGTGRRILE